MRRPLALLVLVPLLLAACGDDDGDVVDTGGTGGDTPVVTYADLDGRTFASTGSTGYEIVEGTTITLAFADERVSANAGCNTLNGGVEVTEGRLETTSPLAATMMSCEEPLMAQDQWLSGFLEAGPDIVLDGDALTLTAGDEVLELSAEP